MFSTLMLFSLLLIPLIWNGMNAVHYLVEHTHTFCASEQSHEHTSAEDCLTICHIAPQHERSQVPVKAEFYELKQCISASSSFNRPLALSKLLPSKADYLLLRGRVLSEGIFRPPIA